MQSLSNLITINPSDFALLGSNLAGIVPVILIGGAVTHATHSVASAIFTDEGARCKSAIAMGSSLVGLVTVSTIIPQVTLVAFSTTFLFQLALITAAVAYATLFADRNGNPNILTAFSVAVPTIGVAAGFLGSSGLLIAGGIASALTALSCTR